MIKVKYMLFSFDFKLVTYITKTRPQDWTEQFNNCWINITRKENSLNTVCAILSEHSDAGMCVHVCVHSLLVCCIWFTNYNTNKLEYSVQLEGQCYSGNRFHGDDTNPVHSIDSARVSSTHHPYKYTTYYLFKSSETV